MSNINNEFHTKLQQARTANIASHTDVRLQSDIAINDSLKRESLKILTATINTIAEELSLDSERVERSVKNARRSEYGRIPELITLLAKIYAWPIESTDQAKEIDDLQERMLDTLANNGINVTHDLMMDIKEAKGYHSFLDLATFEVVDGIEPEYDELYYYLLTFAEEAKLPLVDYKLTRAKWTISENKALAKIQTEQTAAQEALTKHEEMMSA